MRKHDLQVRHLAAAQMALRLASDALVVAGDNLRQIEVLPAEVNAAAEVLQKARTELREADTRVTK